MMCCGRVGWEAELREEEVGKRGEWKGEREVGRSGVEGFESDVRASDNSCVVSTTSPDKIEGSLDDCEKTPPHAGGSLPVIAGFTSSSGELTNCMRSNPPKRLGSRNSSPS